ncbi:hypothetical protein ERJ75_001414300 [Trypanosoma vivax]|uniref:Uncharacterized protein n=1 Tax=Trypanosoma vivax (strain Y486) TaxID=1055687 RepID=G0TUD9_TRYVY|nr:hypothetical protein ERJ75_001414300 [Trypanosoma vivax]CCC47573.1 conserved hypothetical protein [Trypanosoma vivax Y486]
MPEALERLRFLALSVSVHADALQCLVDDTRRALSQMTRDNERLEALEAQLCFLLPKQQRIHKMLEVVNRAKRERSLENIAVSSACTKVSGASRRVSGAGSHRTKSVSVPLSRSSASVVGDGDRSTAQGSRDVLHFASSALDEDSIPKLRSRKSCADSADVLVSPVESVRCERASNEEKIMSEERCTIDDEVARLKAEITRVEGLSVEAKLRELETLKRRAREVDVDALVKHYVRSFRFSEDVENLWSGDSALDRTNIDLFVDSACQRFSRRYEDAFAAMSEFPLSMECAPSQVYGSMLYADALTSSRNYDAAAVQALQDSDRNFLVNFYRGMQRLATVCSICQEREHNTVLGPEEFVFLPSDWPTSQLLLPPGDVHLPPARHIYTPRFSFEDAREMKALQSLRVDVQREAIEAFAQVPEILNDFELRYSKASVEEHRNELDMVMAQIRLLGGGGANDNWTTIAHVE